MRDERLTTGQIILWTALGTGTGLLAGIALSEWLGDVNPQRLRRTATRLQTPQVRRISPAAMARAAESALETDERLKAFGLRASPAGAAAVELHGWVPDRPARALAARVVRGITGIDTVVNSILVRGEDDRAVLDDTPAGNHPA